MFNAHHGWYGEMLRFYDAFKWNISNQPDGIVLQFGQDSLNKTRNHVFKYSSFTRNVNDSKQFFAYAVIDWLIDWLILKNGIDLAKFINSITLNAYIEIIKSSQIAYVEHFDKWSSVYEQRMSSMCIQIINKEDDN